MTARRRQPKKPCPVCRRVIATSHDGERWHRHLHPLTRVRCSGSRPGRRWRPVVTVELPGVTR